MPGAKHPALDERSLATVFVITAALSGLTASVGWLANPDWAGRYAAMAVLALLNWIALALIFVGAFRGQVLKLAGGLMIKPVLLGLLMVAGKFGVVEITSFLLALNTFFIALFGYLAARALVRRFGRGTDTSAGFWSSHG